MIDANSTALEILVAAFAGGAFGAAIGPLPAFVVTGVLVIAGEIVAIVERTVGPETALPAITEAIAFGPVFGPHVSFSGGAAAAAYAARYDIHPVVADSRSDSRSPAKHITSGLGTRPDVLAVGGCFGVAGQFVLAGSVAVDAPWDPVAMGVVLSAILHRIVLGYEVVGVVRSESRFDMTPSATTGEAAADGGRPRPDPWLSSMCRWRNVTAVSLVAGVLAGYIAYVTASPFLAFGVSAATLVLMTAGVERIPVTHHVTLPASTAPFAVAGLSAVELTPAAVASAIPLWEALLLGACFGFVGAIVGELAQRALYAHAETHFDPPAASIVVTTALIAILAMAGVFETAVWIPHP